MTLHHLPNLGGWRHSGAPGGAAPLFKADVALASYVFIISAMAKDVPMRETFAGVMPFFASEIVRIILLLAFPGIVLWLPSVLSG